MKKLTIKTKPVSVNKMYSGRRFLTKDGKATKEAIAWEAKSQLKNHKPSKGDITLNIVFYVSNRLSDIDNLLKGLLDCLTGILYKDDKQITELHVYKEIDKEYPRTEITFL